MSDNLFDVVFSGQLSGTLGAAEAQRAIQALFRLDDANAARLFSGRRVVIKRGVDLATAQRYQSAFHEAGAVAEIEPRDEPETIIAAPPPAEDPEPDAEFGPAAEPPRRRRLSLNDPQPAPAPASLSLAPPGAPLDEIDDRGPPRHPDTSALSLVADSDWTLEDCAPAAAPAHIPDSGDLELEPIEPTRPRGAADTD